MLLTSTQAFSEALTNNEMSLIYFSSDTCAICQSLKPKVMQKIQENFSKIACYEINISKHSELSAQLSIFTAPTVIVYIEGKEFIRKSRVFSIDTLVDELQRPYTLFYT